LESSRPVHGSVLIEHGNVYFAAGISSYLDKGIYLYRLDAETGELITTKIVNDRDPETGHQPARLENGSYLDGALTDVLSGDDLSIFMRHRRFSKDLEERDPDVPHLYSSIGFLDDSWWHRSYWIYAEQMGEGWGGWSRMGRNVPSGRLLVKDGNVIYGFGRSQYGRHGSHAGLDASIAHGYNENSDSPETTYRLFCATRSGEDDRWTYPWIQQEPLLARAMIKTRNKLCLAGIPDKQKMEQWTEAMEGKGEGLLCLVSPSTGEKTAIYKIASPPVWNGMAAAGGSLYMSLTNGSVICLSGMNE
jgi:hypothetical protein